MTQKEIINKYIELCDDTREVKSSYGYPRYVNQKQRDKLIDKYNKTLPENQQLAMLLHKHLCPVCCTDCCEWYDEMKNGIEHKWDGHTHQRWLRKAERLLAHGIDKDTMLLVFHCLKDKQKIMYSREMRKQDELWKQEKEDINTMQSLFVEIMTEAREKGFIGTIAIYSWENEALIDVAIDDEIETFGNCKSLIKRLEDIINR